MCVLARVSVCVQQVCKQRSEWWRGIGNCGIVRNKRTAKGSYSASGVGVVEESSVYVVCGSVVDCLYCRPLRVEAKGAIASRRRRGPLMINNCWRGVNTRPSTAASVPSSTRSCQTRSP